MSGEELKAARKAMHWTQRMVGRVCGVHPNTVAKWERNAQNIPQTVEVVMTLLEYRDNRALVEKKYLIPH